MSDSSGETKKPHTFQDTINEVRAYEEWGAKSYYRLLREDNGIRVARIYNQDAYLYTEQDFVSPYNFATQEHANVAIKLINDVPLSYADKELILSGLRIREE